MEYVLFKKIIDQIAEFPNKLKRLSVNFRGEPLLHNKLPDMISYAKKKDVSEFITLTTNGYLLEPKLNRKLVSAGLDDLRVSVEALSTERYKEITGVSVNYDRFLNNIRNFYINKGKCKVNIMPSLNVLYQCTIK
jgi:MoaA/NifB/PqqE/SkfB family radical SAM enzyme